MQSLHLSAPSAQAARVIGITARAWGLAPRTRRRAAHAAPRIAHAGRQRPCALAFAI